MGNKTKNVFISHLGKDDIKVQALRRLLRMKGYTVRNASIDSTKPNNAENGHYIKYDLLRPGINWAGTMIVLIGDKTYTSDWVNWEIEQAAKLNTRVIGAYIKGLKTEDPPLPEAFEKFGDALVGWNGDKIIDAIEGRINNFRNTDGSLRPSIYGMAHSTC